MGISKTITVRNLHIRNIANADVLGTGNPTNLFQWVCEYQRLGLRYRSLRQRLLHTSDADQHPD